ncbi:MAG: hypothetical protein ACOCVE_00670, partial [Desulfovermiculus sp.]
ILHQDGILLTLVGQSSRPPFFVLPGAFIRVLHTEITGKFLGGVRLARAMLGRTICQDRHLLRKKRSNYFLQQSTNTHHTCKLFWGLLVSKIVEEYFAIKRFCYSLAAISLMVEEKRQGSRKKLGMPNYSLTFSKRMAIVCSAS